MVRRLGFPFPVLRGVAPLHFTAQQRVSVRPLPGSNPIMSLYCARSEFDDIVAQVCRNHNADGQPFFPSPELQEYISQLSNGHARGVRAVLDALVHSEVSTH